MQSIISLSELQPGEKCAVIDIYCTDAIRRRLQDLGLVRGAEITCVRKSPLGDPVAYLICGALIALRCEDSSYVRAVRL